MKPLQQHVDQLFRRYAKDTSDQIQDLKREVLSNLEAKVADLTANGVEQREAIRQAVQSITSVDHLIDRNRNIFVFSYCLEFVQITLLYLLIAWIIVLPLQIIHMGGMLHLLLLISIAVVGLLYITLLIIKRMNPGIMQKTAVLDLQAAFRFRKIGWLIWGLFVLVWLLFTTALEFGSNIWFWRQVKIGGPYQFAVLAVRYALPFFSVILPMLLHVSPKLIMKYEVHEDE
ncbi:hypothetical protein EDM52_09795 [Brevibacillus invocatus]|uniref:Uncharacterized protein n=1 Tax=Brevibacillus invocatus TaxID=173959 RepID=A0A3M8CFL7_9BACL|nr:permease prefix domain 1-containing protein [Brevibacillus invocatus]RNB74544.1 hypothetical protein EDM52_09795 [Brevibacillus invocatus]